MYYMWRETVNHKNLPSWIVGDTFPLTMTITSWRGFCHLLAGGYIIYHLLYMYISGWWFQPLWKILSIGRIIPYIMDNKKNVWNHQPHIYIYIYGVYTYLYHLISPCLLVASPFLPIVVPYNSMIISYFPICCWISPFMSAITLIPSSFFSWVISLSSSN